MSAMGAEYLRGMSVECGRRCGCEASWVRTMSWGGTRLVEQCAVWGETEAWGGWVRTMSWGGTRLTSADVKLRTAGGSDVWLQHKTGILQGREQRIKTSVASRCIWRGTFAETLGGCHGQCRHRRRTTVPAGRQRQQQPRSDNVRASGVGFGGLLGNAKTSEAMGGARLRVETSFEERYTAAVAPPVGYLSEENTWATHAIGIFSHPLLRRECSELSGWSCQ